MRWLESFPSQVFGLEEQVGEFRGREEVKIGLPAKRVLSWLRASDASEQESTIFQECLSQDIPSLPCVAITAEAHPHLLTIYTKLCSQLSPGFTVSLITFTKMLSFINTVSVDIASPYLPFSLLRTFAVYFWVLDDSWPSEAHSWPSLNPVLYNMGGVLADAVAEQEIKESHSPCAQQSNWQALRVTSCISGSIMHTVSFSPPPIIAFPSVVIDLTSCSTINQRWLLWTFSDPLHLPVLLLRNRMDGIRKFF